MGRAWLLAPVLVLALGACGEDEAVAAATQEAYDEEAARLCEQHGDTLAVAFSQSHPDSDAEEAAFYTTDLVPRVRAIAARLSNVGLPAERAEDYRAALDEALAVVAELEANPHLYIDRRQARMIPPSEDLVVRLRAALDAADVPC